MFKGQVRRCQVTAQIKLILGGLLGNFSKYHHPC